MKRKKNVVSTKKVRQRAMRQIPIMKCVKCQTYKKGDIPYTAIKSLKKSEEKKNLLQVHCAAAVAAFIMIIR